MEAKSKLVAEFAGTNEGADQNQITPMAKRTKALLGTERLTVVADAGYDNALDFYSALLELA